MPPPSRYCKRKEPPGTHLRNQPAKGGRGVGTPGRAAQMPVAEGLPAHAAGPDRSGLSGRSRQACGGTPRRMVVMGHPGRRSGPGTAGRQRKPAETAAGHHHLVQPLGAFLLPVVSPQQHAHVFRLAAARRPAGRRLLASGSQGSRARSGRSVRHPGRAGPRALEKGGAASVRRGMAGGTNAHGQTARKGRGRLEQPHGHETHHSSLERRRPHRAQGPLAETGRHPLLGGPTDRGGPDAGEPLVCVASVLGHVDEATGKRMSA